MLPDLSNAWRLRFFAPWGSMIRGFFFTIALICPFAIAFRDQWLGRFLCGTATVLIIITTLMILAQAPIHYWGIRRQNKADKRT